MVCGLRLGKDQVVQVQPRRGGRGQEGLWAARIVRRGFKDWYLSRVSGIKYLKIRKRKDF